MDKPTLRIGFVDYFKPMDTFFMETLATDFTIVRDDQDPDYLFFCDENYGVRNKEYDNKKCVKIFYTGENRRPWNYSCNFAISFDHLTGNNVYRLPLYVLDNWWYKKSLGLEDIRDIHRNNYAADKTGFCSFVVRNGHNPVRNDMFHKLSEYKKVDSAGEWLNNTGYILDRSPGKFHTSKLDFLRTRKFNLCYENGQWPGYVTEKLYHALYAGTIPIYWGSPTVGLDFNPDAIISRHDFETDEGMIDWIIRVDEEDWLYDDIVNKPIFRYNEWSRLNYFDLTRFNRWFMENVYGSFEKNAA